MSVYSDTSTWGMASTQVVIPNEGFNSIITVADLVQGGFVRRDADGVYRPINPDQLFQLQHWLRLLRGSRSKVQ